MDYFQLSKDLGELLAWTVGLGAVGGLGLDVLEPIAVSKDDAFTGFENKTRLPRLLKKPLSIDWGLLGPMFLGALAALIAVFLIAVENPADPTTENVTQLTERLTDVGVSDDTIQQLNLDEPTPASADLAKVFWLSLLAGFASPMILRAARTKLVDLVNGFAYKAAETSAKVASAETAKKLMAAETAKKLMAAGSDEPGVLPEISKVDLQMVQTEAIQVAMDSLRIPSP